MENKKMLDSYDTLGSIWQEAYNLIGNYENIKIVMDNQGYEIINLENNEIVQSGDII
jgi:hypothetical protein